MAHLWQKLRLSSQGVKASTWASGIIEDKGVDSVELVIQANKSVGWAMAGGQDQLDISVDLANCILFVVKHKM